MNSVYLIRNRITGKLYVGQTVLSIEERFKWHCYYNPIKDLHNDIFKYGKENFTIETLCVCPTVDDMDKAERFFIEFLGCRKKSLGYNTAKGGSYRISSKLTYEEMEKIIKKKVKNKTIRNFIEYELFKLPDSERRAYEKILKQEGYRL